MNQPTISLNHSILYFILFVLALFCVAGLLSVWILLAVVVVSVALWDRAVLKKVDYSLLATFAAFFVFIGNMGRMSAFHDFVQKIVLGNEQITAVLPVKLSAMFQQLCFYLDLPMSGPSLLLAPTWAAWAL